MKDWRFNKEKGIIEDVWVFTEEDFEKLLIDASIYIENKAVAERVVELQKPSLNDMTQGSRALDRAKFYYEEVASIMKNYNPKDIVAACEKRNQELVNACGKDLSKLSKEQYFEKRACTLLKNTAEQMMKRNIKFKDNTFITEVDL